jgi:hypothetical protein
MFLWSAYTTCSDFKVGDFFIRIPPIHTGSSQYGGISPK